MIFKFSAGGHGLQVLQGVIYILQTLFPKPSEGDIAPTVFQLLLVCFPPPPTIFSTSWVLEPEPVVLNSWRALERRRLHHFRGQNLSQCWQKNAAWCNVGGHREFHINNCQKNLFQDFSFFQALTNRYALKRALSHPVKDLSCFFLLLLRREPCLQWAKIDVCVDESKWGGNCRKLNQDSVLNQPVYLSSLKKIELYGIHIQRRHWKTDTVTGSEQFFCWKNAPSEKPQRG